MIKKLTSKRGYVFTYEAIIIAFIFLSIFYIGYAVYSYNLLTGVEEKKNAEQYHKAILLKDFFIKSSSFPGKYYVDLYYRDFLNDLNIQEKTFDPLNNFSKFNGSVQFIINPNIYDDELSDYSNDLKNTGLQELNFTFGTKTFTIYSNVYNNPPTTSSLSISGDNILYFTENAYIPKITGMGFGNNFNLYGCEGDHIYFKVNSEITSASARVMTSQNNNFAQWADWKFASPIVIINQLNQSLDNYDVKVVFDSEEYIANNQMREDCGDVRFIDENGNELNYWIEPNTINTHHTVAWVKVNLAPNEHKIIYMLYGNPNAKTTANGEKTFMFFDDFSEKKIDTTKWKYNFNNPLFLDDTYANGMPFVYLSLDYNYYNNGKDDAHIITYQIFNDHTAIRFHANFHKKYDEWAGFYELNPDGTDYNREVITNYHWGGEYLRAESSVSDEDHDSYIVLQDLSLYNTWNTYEIERNGKTSVNFIIDHDGEEIYKMIYSNIYTGELPIAFYARRFDDSTTYGYIPTNDDEKNGNISIDWVFVRPYVSPEPEVRLTASDVIFTVNGYIYEKPLTSMFRSIDITPNLKTGVNEIRILSSPLPVNFEINMENDASYYYLTLSPRNITIMVKS